MSIHETGGPSGPQETPSSTKGKGVSKESKGSLLMTLPLPRATTIIGKLFLGFRHRSVTKQIKSNLITQTQALTDLDQTSKAQIIKKIGKLSTKQAVRPQNVVATLSSDSSDLKTLLINFLENDHSQNLKLPSYISDSAVGKLIKRNNTEGANKIKRVITQEKEMLGSSNFDEKHAQAIGRQLSDHLNEETQSSFKINQTQLDIDYHNASRVDTKASPEKQYETLRNPEGKSQEIESTAVTSAVSILNGIWDESSQGNKSYYIPSATAAYQYATQLGVTEAKRSNLVAFMLKVHIDTGEQITSKTPDEEILRLGQQIASDAPHYSQLAQNLVDLRKGKNV